MDTVLLLYYKAPYEEEPELICACGSQSAAASKMSQLHANHPDAYPDMKRFQTITVQYFE